MKQSKPIPKPILRPKSQSYCVPKGAYDITHCSLEHVNGRSHSWYYAFQAYLQYLYAQLFFQCISVDCHCHFYLQLQTCTGERLSHFIFESMH